MSDADCGFLADTSPANGLGFVRRAQNLPIVVLVVDDSDDDELACLLAGGDVVVATDHDAAWSAQVNGEGLIVKFSLIRHDGAWERKWTYTDPGDSVLNAITAGTHHVAIMPLVGDLSEFVREGLGGGIIVDAAASGAIASARELVALRAPVG
jgi:hypothetical protein